MTTHVCLSRLDMYAADVAALRWRKRPTTVLYCADALHFPGICLSLPCCAYLETCAHFVKAYPTTTVVLVDNGPQMMSAVGSEIRVYLCQVQYEFV